MRRVRELVTDVLRAHPNDSFFDRFDESCVTNPAKRKAYRTYDDALRLLDSDSWNILKGKAIAHFRDHRRGQHKQGFFNQLNEAFAYRHLVRQGFTAVRMLPEEGRRVPDIRYRDGRYVKHCEVKTIGISDEERSQDEDRSKHSPTCTSVSRTASSRRWQAISPTRSPKLLLKEQTVSYAWSWSGTISR